jgi:Tol biopolymer transport system component
MWLSVAARRAAVVVLVLAAPFGGAENGAAGSRGAPGRNGRIVFARVSLDGAGPSQIFTIKQDGTSLRKLTRSSGDKLSPSYSADGKRIAFARAAPGTSPAVHLVVMDSDGAHRRQLTDGTTADSDPRFNPTGRTLVFSRRGARSGIYSIRADGSHSRLLVRDAEKPVYSPDGLRIAYESFADGKHGLFVMNADGSHRRQLTRDPLSAPDPAGQREFLHRDHDPDFAPDGRRIVFIRQEVGCAAGGDVYVMKPNGTNMHRVTDSGENCADYSGPAFSPGGKRIVVSSLSHLDVMRIDGSHRRVLRAGRHQYYSPDWQPLPR